MASEGAHPASTKSANPGYEAERWLASWRTGYQHGEPEWDMDGAAAVENWKQVTPTSANRMESWL